MAIDPEMYKKYSGRSGDPYERLGSALAQSDARRAERHAELGKSYTQRRIEGKMQVNRVVWIVLGLIGLVVALATLAR